MAVVPEAEVVYIHYRRHKGVAALVAWFRSALDCCE